MKYVFSKYQDFIEKLKCQLKNQDEVSKNFKRWVEDELEVLKDTLSNKEELKKLADKVDKLEVKPDKFIADVLVTRDGNKVTLKYVYADDTFKEVKFDDNDTISDSQINALGEKVEKLLVEIKELEAFRDKIKKEFNDNEVADEVWQ